MEEESNNKRIAKNTLFLYFRMLLVLVVTLFTSRVILHTLGVEDYGTYNVVGGIVTMFSFLSGSMAGATSRYLTFELGRQNYTALAKTFGASLIIYIIIAGIVLVLGEILGLWFVYEKLVVSPERFNAALCVLQFTIFTAMVSCIQLPFMSSIISHENMSIYAYIGIYEALSKLIIAYCVYIAPFDKLIFFGLIIMLNQLLISLFYIIYSKRNYFECRFQIVKDKELYKKLTAYSGYDMTGSIALVVQTQGLNMLLNVFFGPTINAARAIAVQINGAIIQFVNNFLMAVKPQVIKKYAANDTQGMYTLAFRTGKYSYYLMLLLCLPFFFEMDVILKLWLGDGYPQETSIFAKIILAVGLVQVLIYSVNMIMHAIGRLKEPCILNTLCYIAPFGVSYILFILGAPSYYAFISIFVFYIGIFSNTLYWMHRFEYFDVQRFFFDNVVKIALITGLSCITPLLIINTMEEGIHRFILLASASEISCILLIFFYGISKEDRYSLVSYVKRKINGK